MQRNQMVYNDKSKTSIFLELIPGFVHQPMWLHSMLYSVARSLAGLESKYSPLSVVFDPLKAHFSGDPKHDLCLTLLNL